MERLRTHSAPSDESAPSHAQASATGTSPGRSSRSPRHAPSPARILLGAGSQEVQQPTPAARIATRESPPSLSGKQRQAFVAEFVAAAVLPPYVREALGRQLRAAGGSPDCSPALDDGPARTRLMSCAAIGAGGRVLLASFDEVSDDRAVRASADERASSTVDVESADDFGSSDVDVDEGEETVDHLYHADMLGDLEEGEGSSEDEGEPAADEVAAADGDDAPVTEAHRVVPAAARTLHIPPSLLAAELRAKLRETLLAEVSSDDSDDEASPFARAPAVPAVPAHVAQVLRDRYVSVNTPAVVAEGMSRALDASRAEASPAANVDGAADEPPSAAGAPGTSVGVSQALRSNQPADTQPAVRDSLLALLASHPPRISSRGRPASPAPPSAAVELEHTSSACVTRLKSTPVEPEQQPAQRPVLLILGEAPVSDDELSRRRGTLLARTEKRRTEVNNLVTHRPPSIAPRQRTPGWTPVTAARLSGIENQDPQIQAPRTAKPAPAAGAQERRARRQWSTNQPPPPRVQTRPS
ncbi:hypothetical protein T492DRAFT_1049075 [Pavlovales sp. CCMP2436]|nr:hypothetical protein T492DRAFT_1049075 [Pavlovales sp. CCMP2436]